MRVNFLFMFALLSVISVDSEAFAKCRDGLEKVSCSSVQGHKRKSFCYKGKLTEEKKTKACMQTSRSKKNS